MLTGDVVELMPSVQNLYSQPHDEAQTELFFCLLLKVFEIFAPSSILKEYNFLFKKILSVRDFVHGINFLALPTTLLPSSHLLY